MQRITSQLVGTTLLIALFAKVQASLQLKMPKPDMPETQHTRFVFLGENVKLLCTYTSTSGTNKLVIKKDDQPVMPSDEEHHIITANSSTVGGKHRLEISIHNATYEDSGNYRCKYDTESVELLMEVISVVNESFLVLPNVTTATLRCKIVHSSSYKSKALTTIWFRKLGTGQLEEVLNDTNIQVSKEELNIANLHYKKNENLGEYLCEVKPGINARVWNYTVTINAAAGVEPMPESKKGVQGSRLEVKFIVYGFPLDITWTHNNETIVFDDRRYVGIDKTATRSLVNNTLTFTSLEYSDRGYYVCNVSNEYGSKGSEILIRVKDPLAALWPFLGILVQAIVLFLLIFFCEKRKQKTEGPSGAPTSHDNPAIQDDENVRRRYAPGASHVANT